MYIGIGASFLCDLVNNIQIGSAGNASLINGVGDTIGYSDFQLVLDAYNTQEEVKAGKSLQQLVDVELQVMSGKTGFDSYSYAGVAKYAAYAPVEGTEGWGIYIAVEKDEFLLSTYVGIAVVAAGAEQMAQNAQAMAEGATEQAGAVEELNATITDVTAKAEGSAENAKEAYEKA